MAAAMLPVAFAVPLPTDCTHGVHHSTDCTALLTAMGFGKALADVSTELLWQRRLVDSPACDMLLPKCDPPPSSASTKLTASVSGCPTMLCLRFLSLWI